jgi:hypothetical protein
VNTKVFALLMATAAETPSELRLSSDAIWLLVMSTPAAIRVEAGGGCPNVDIGRSDGRLIYAQLRNMCPKSGTGLVENFTIEPGSMMIWIGTDRREYVRSERLTRLRRVLGRQTESR